MRTIDGEVELAALEQGEGPLVICLHGFPDAMWGWQPLLAALAGAGRHAVAPALRGYAPSALPPRARTTPLDLARDVLAVADACEAERFDVVGHDWGAVTAYAVAALAPERVGRLVAAAIPHTGHFLSHPTPAQLWRSRYMAKFQLPGAAERWVPRDGFAWLDALIRSWSPSWEPSPADLFELRRGMPTPAHLTAALGYYRGLALVGSPGVRAVAFGRAAAPALVVHGADDGCVAADRFAGQDSWFTGGLRVEQMAGVGHFVHREATEAFNALVLEHLVG